MIILALAVTIGLIVLIFSRRRARRQTVSLQKSSSMPEPVSTPSDGPTESGAETLRDAVPRLDAPARLLAAVVSWLPSGRVDWGRAMLAELDQVEGSSSRWHFAIGCVRVTAAGIVRGGRPSWVATAAIGAVAAGIGVAIGLISTQLRVFGLLLAGGVAACAWLAVMRARRADRSQPAASVLSRVVVLVGVFGSVVASMYGVVHFPRAGSDSSHVYAVFFAAMLVGYLWLVVSPPTSAGWGRAAARYGLIATGVVLALWSLALIGSVLLGRSIVGVTPAVLVPVVAVVGGLVGARTRSVAAASVVSLYGGTVAAVTLFVVGMTATITNSYPTFATHELAVSDNLGGLIAFLLLLPLATVSLGTVAGALGVQSSSSGAGTSAR
jgi:hypothetical protein